MSVATQSPDSVLFITLDSCRYDTFECANAPNLKKVGALHRAQAPSYYTYGSHSAMFVGFTPGTTQTQRPILNPKIGKLFKIVGAGFPGKDTEAYELTGRNIIEGFENRGFSTIGSGAVGWFNPEVPSGRHLTESFQQFFFAGDGHSVGRQVDWTINAVKEANGKGRENVFVFINIGETHVPYYFDQAPWSREDNPCIPFQTVDRAQECRERQRQCCEFVDRALAPILTAFAQSTILICADHGDCWGEDGLWEHGISHPATLTVPLIVRVRGVPVEELAAPSALGLDVR